MPRATKDSPAKPFDVEDAIRRAAKCRATRERVGLNVDAFAHYVGVTVRSVNRWESWDGRGSCPDDIQSSLDQLVDLQIEVMERARKIVEQWGQNRTPVRGTPVRPCPGGQAPVKGAEISPVKGAEVSPVKEAAISQNAGEPVKGSAISGGWPVKDAELSNMGYDGLLAGLNEVDGEIVVTLLYHPNQHTYDANMRDGGYHGVWNATARAVAQELEAYGYVVDWKYATA